MIEKSLEPVAVTPETVARALDALHGGVNFQSPFLSLKAAAAYCGRSVQAFLKFAAKLGLLRCGDGTYRRADLDRIKRQAFRTNRGQALRARQSQSR